MRFSHSLTAVAALSISAIVAHAAPRSAVVVTGKDISRAVSQLSPQFTDDEPLRVLDAGVNRLGVFIVGRPKKSGPERITPDGAVAVTEGLQLDQVSAIVQVLSGAGEFVTGGTLVAPMRMPPDDPDAAVIGPGSRGKAILGGERRRIVRGDMVIIPAGVPHGFAVIEAPITYLVIRVDTGRTLPLE
jgi:hypothetical protein